MEALDNTASSIALIDKANALGPGPSTLNDFHRTIWSNHHLDQELAISISLALIL